MNLLTHSLQSAWQVFYERRQRLLQWAVVIGVLAASAGSAYLFKTQDQLIYLLLPVPGVVGLVVLLRYPALGLILTYVAGVFIQAAGPSNLSVTTLGIAGMVGLWLAKLFIVDRQIVLIDTPLMRPMIVFLVVTILSFGIGQLPLIAFASPAPLDAQLGGMATFILSVGAFLVTAHLFDRRWLLSFTWVVILIGTMYMFGRILSSQGIPIGRPFAPGATTNSMFWTWTMAMAFGQAFLNTRLHKGVRLGLLGVVGVVAYVAYVLSNDWKSGWVPSFAVLAAIVGLRYWRVSLFLLPFAAAVAVIAGIYIIGTDEYSWGTRLDAWVIVVEMVAQYSPLFGLGFANYYWYSRFFPIRGYFVPFNSHSQYIDILAQTGIIGSIVFLWIFVDAARMAWRLLERVPEGFERGYLYGVLGGIVGTLVAAGLADWVLPFTYNIGLGGFRSSVLPWMFIGGLVCIEQFVEKDTARR
jgi:hypothetical protein